MIRGPSTTGCHRACVLPLLLMLAAMGLGRVRQAEAQAVPAAYGTLSGAAAGVLVTTGIFVAKARAGSFIYSLDDALAPRWELIPAVAMPVGGLVMGLDDDQQLARSIAWGGAGFAAGALVGYGIGELFSDTDQGKWAGAIIGSAAGVLAGSLYGMLSYDSGETSPLPIAGSAQRAARRRPLLSFRVPL